MKIKITKVTVTKNTGRKRSIDVWDDGRIIDFDKIEDLRREIQAGDPDKAVRFNYEETDG